MLSNQKKQEKRVPSSYAICQTQDIDSQQAEQNPLQKVNVFYKPIIFVQFQCADIPRKSEKNDYSCSETPLYLLIQSSTSLCHTSEFSGLSTHLPPVSTCIYFLKMNMRCMLTYMILVREHDKLARHATNLEGVEHCQALRDWQTIIELVMDDL